MLILAFNKWKQNMIIVQNDLPIKLVKICFSIYN